MYPAKNPAHISGSELNFDKCEFHSEMFVLDAMDSNGDAKRYEQLMGKLYPFDPTSDMQLNPNGNAVTKTWTKMGDLLIQVEYIEMIRDKKDESADDKDY